MLLLQATDILVTCRKTAPTTSLCLDEKELTDEKGGQVLEFDPARCLHVLTFINQRVLSVFSNN